MQNSKYVLMTMTLNEFSQVVLKRPDRKQLDYINANYVNFGDREYIITQRHLPSTIGDYFTMLSKEKM
jgi:protein tyrosine phosphatase